MSDSRFEILDQPIMPPGKCVGCGVTHGTADRKFIDFKLDLEWYGTLYICTYCFTEIANMVGYISEEQWKDLKLDATSVADHNDELILENEALRESVVTLGSHKCRSNQPNIAVPREPERKELPAEKPVAGTVASPENAKPDVGKGPSNTKRTESSPGPSLDVIKI